MAVQTRSHGFRASPGAMLQKAAMICGLIIWVPLVHNFGVHGDLGDCNDDEK
jgi:hypothetical protein